MPTKKDLYIIILWIAMTLVVAILFILPSLNSIQSAANGINNRLAQLEALQAKGQLKNEVDKNFKLVMNNTAALEQVTQKKGEELKFITSMEELANNNNLQQKMNITLKKIEKKDDQPADSQTALSFQLTIDGSFYNFITYLQELEKTNYYLNLENIKINKSAGVSPRNFIGKTEEPDLDDPNYIHIIINGISFWQ